MKHSQIPPDLFEQLQEDVAACEFVVGLAQTSDVRASLRQLVLPILRKWFVHGWLRRVQNAINIEILFESFGTDGLDDYFYKFQNGFYQMSGMPGGPQRLFHTVLFVGIGDIQKAMMEIMKSPSNFEKSEFSIERFMDQKILFFEGVWATRLEMIKFAANNLGATHFDYRIKHPVANMLMEASARTYCVPGQNALSLVPRRSNESAQRESKSNLGSLTCLEVELLSISFEFAKAVKSSWPPRP